MWKGGTFVNSQGYIYEIDRTADRKLDGGYRYKAQHIRVAEETIGRPIAKGEDVHHLNSKHADNRSTNLIVLPEKLHRKLHGFYSQQFQLEHEAKGDLVEITLRFLEENH